MHLDVPRRSHDGPRYIIGNAYVIAQSDAAKSRGRKGSRSIAVPARAGRRVVAEVESDRQQVTLRRALGTVGSVICFPLASGRIALHGEPKSKSLTSARSMRVARWNPDSTFPSGRGYHLTRPSFRRTDGRPWSDGEAQRASATGEGRPARDLSPPSRPSHHPPRRMLVLLL
jgi:hypothetical protein